MTNLFAVLALASATSNFSGTKVSTDTSWDQIDNYIRTYATSGDQATIDRIHTEALLGIETWELVGPGSAS